MRGSRRRWAYQRLGRCARRGGVAPGGPRGVAGAWRQQQEGREKDIYSIYLGPCSLCIIKREYAGLEEAMH